VGSGWGWVPNDMGKRLKRFNRDLWSKTQEGTIVLADSGGGNARE